MNPVQFYKCLADETRLRSLLMIQLKGELCVCEITAMLNESQPKISRHLAQLRKCGILLDRKQGQWVFYQVNPDLADWAKSILAVSAENNRSFLQDNINRLNTLSLRPNKTSCC